MAKPKFKGSNENLRGPKFECCPPEEDFLDFCVIICDMIKGNESLIENFNSYFLTPLSHNFKMPHFDPNPTTIGYLVTEL